MIASLKNIARASLAMFVLLAGGCEMESPTSGTTPVVPAFSPSVVPVTGFVSDEPIINHYAVRFDGRTFANDQTTFTYTVRGTGVDPSLSHFTIELPGCAPALASYSPTNSANINTNQSSGIYGIEWHLSVAKDNFEGRTYSITFPGDVPLGIVRAEAKTEGGVSGIDYVYGPCAGSRITGKVFVDADENGILSLTESGIANVTVSISDGTASVEAITDASGDYAFLVATGTYTVSVPAATAALDFNEDLYASFTAFSATSIELTVSGDSPGNNFGFGPQTDKLLNDLFTGVLTTDGKPVKFWKSELKSAINGGSRSTYTAAQMAAFVQQVQAFGNAVPFQFTPGNELNEALAILSVNGKNDFLGLLLKQLLASELNFVSGNTLVGEADLHEVLLLWGEELAVQPVTPATIITFGTTNKLNPYEDGTDLLGAMNGSTGGGGGDE